MSNLSNETIAVVFMLLVGWVWLGRYWVYHVGEDARREGREFKFRLPLGQWMVLLLGINIQVGVMLHWLSATRPGWIFFVFLPPLLTWGLLEGTRPITTPRTELPLLRKRRAKDNS